EAVAGAERLLHRSERTVGLGEPLGGDDLGAVGLHREHEAGPDRLAVEQDRAGPAHAVLAGEVHAGGEAVLPERVGQGLAGLDSHAVAGAVDGERHGPLVGVRVEGLVGHALAPAASLLAAATASSASRMAIRRRFDAEAWMSSDGSVSATAA